MTIIKELSIEAQRKATSEILDKMGNILNNNQLMQLNITLNENLSSIQLLEKNDDPLLNNEYNNQYFVHQFIKAKSVAGLSERTIGLYKNTLMLLLEYIPCNLTELTTEDLREFFEYLEGRHNCGKVTLDNYRRQLSSFFTWLHHNDYLLKNPMRPIKKIKSIKKEKKSLTSYELELLRDNINNVRDKAIFELLLSSGIRVGELVRLNIFDMHFDNLTFAVTGKGNKQRVVYFNNKAKYAIKKYLDSRKDDNPALFLSRKGDNRIGINGVERWIRELGRKAGVDNVHPHRFRRTFATNMIRKNMPIEQVQRVMGHTSISTTMIYVNIDDDTVKMNHQRFTN